MVSWAQERVTGATWQQADAQELGFADGSFDLVVCQFGIMFLPDKRRALAETARVLSPGGSALFTAWDMVETSEFPAALGASLAVLLPDDPPTFVARVPHGYTDRDQMTADFESAGLQSIRVERVVLRGRAPSAGVLAEGFCLGTPLRFELEERGQVEVLTAAVAREMTVRLGAGPVEGDLAAFVITARKAVVAQT